MNQPFENELVLGLASRKRRIAAFIIDHFIMTFFILSMVFLALGPDFMDEDNLSKMPIVMLAVMLPGFLLYFAKDSIRGISPGKWILGIRVRDEVNPAQTPSFGRLLIRNLFIVIWPVEFIALAVSRDKKRLGDKSAKTIVVKNTNKPRIWPRILALIGVAAVFFVFVFLFVGKTMKSSDAYKVAVAEIELNQVILEETGGILGYGMTPTGSINYTNGSGEANLQIKVLGKERDVEVSVYLTKQPNSEWELMEMSN